MRNHPVRHSREGGNLSSIVRWNIAFKEYQEQKQFAGQYATNNLYWENERLQLNLLKPYQSWNVAVAFTLSAITLTVCFILE